MSPVSFGSNYVAVKSSNLSPKQNEAYKQILTNLNAWGIDYRTVSTKLTQSNSDKVKYYTDKTYFNVPDELDETVKSLNEGVGGVLHTII